MVRRIGPASTRSEPYLSKSYSRRFPFFVTPPSYRRRQAGEDEIDEGGEVNSGLRAGGIVILAEDHAL